MSSFARVLLFSGLVVLIGGCGPTQEVTTTYDSESDQTRYETDEYAVTSASGADFASAKSITAQAVAKCVGTNCTPNTAQLVFRVERNQEFYLSGVNGKIVADDTTIEWTSGEANRDFANQSPAETIQVSGRFASVPLDYAQVQTIASATSLSGTIGGQELTLSSGLQSGLRAFVEKLSRENSSPPSADR